MNHLAPAPTRLLKFTAAVARGLLGLLVAAWLLFALALVALHGWIVPRIDEFRPALEAQASRVLGVPVRIGAIRARSEGESLFPSFELQAVRLLDAQGRTALLLPRVVAAVSPRSVWNLGFEQLYIDRPELDVRRAADGRITVAGLDFSRREGQGTEAQDWFFAQTEFVIKGGTVRWTDEQRAAGTLALSDVDFVLRNSARRHNLRLDATPPAEWGDRFTLMGQFRQPLLTRRAGDWHAWDGQVHADLPRIDLSELRRHADIGAEIREGLGAVRVWADVSKGQFTGGTADLALTEVDVLLGQDLQPLALRSVSGRLGGRRLEGGFEFSTAALQFDTADGLHWPGGNVFLRYAEPARGQASGEFRADKLELAALAQIANRLPLGESVHTVLSRHAPRGLVETVQATWSGPIDATTSYNAKGRISGLEIASSAPAGASGTPGVRGLTADFEMTQAGGKAAVSIARGALDLPGVFEDPVVPVEQLSADASWTREGEKLGVQVDKLRFANVDAQGEARATWHTSDPAVSSSRSRFPGVLDLTGSLARADGTRVWRYLPAHLPKTVRDYVHEAVTAGVASDVKFRVKGDLHDMPFTDPKKGEFHIAAPLRGVNFAYVPRSLQPQGELPWPALTQLAGELVFDRSAMQVKGASTRFQNVPGLQATQVEALIPDLGHTQVMVDASIKGPLADALKLVQGSPIAAITGQALGKATGTGNADVQLKLLLPVSAIHNAKVSGSVNLTGNDVQFTPDTPQLQRARGQVGFTETGFTVMNGQARMLGGDLKLEGGSRNVNGEMVVNLRAQGTASAEGLRQAKELGFISRLAQSATGGAAYTAVLGFRRGVAELSVNSNLQGLGLNLPAPLNKAADTSLPLRFENSLLATAAGANAPLHDQLVLELGRVAVVNYVRDVSGAQARVLRGSIALGLSGNESAPMPDEGVLANISLGSVDVDAWEAVLSRSAGTSLSTAAAAAPVTGATAPTDAQAVMGYMPTQLAVRAKDITVDGRKLNNVVLGGSREGLTWRANLDAAELNGYLEYRQASGAAAGRLYARLARMSIAQGATRDVEAILDEQPSNLPALDIVVDDFELAGKRLGRMEVDAVNRGGGPRDGGVREWRLNKLNFTTPDGILTATGNWAAIGGAATPAALRGARAPAERRRTVMNFKLDVANAGDLLARFGMKDVIRRGKGRMEGQVAWVGSPFTLDYPSMSGQFNVNIEEGQFLKADPGLAKLLGVLSLQSLPRRLTLDFRDVFTEGFSFDFIRGDVKIEQGMANTNNLQMKGVNAAVLMDGRASLAAETQDLRVIVIPEINAGTASLVATAINPAIGLGSFLAQLFLRRPLMQAATQEFHIDGTWTEPRIVKVARSGPIPEIPPSNPQPADRPAERSSDKAPEKVAQ